LFHGATAKHFHLRKSNENILVQQNSGTSANKINFWLSLSLLLLPQKELGVKNCVKG
jgi:hypothetical protein